MKKVKVILISLPDLVAGLVSMMGFSDDLFGLSLPSRRAGMIQCSINPDVPPPKDCDGERSGMENQKSLI